MPREKKTTLPPVFVSAFRLAEQVEAQATLSLADIPLDWKAIEKGAKGIPSIVACDDAEIHAAAIHAGLKTILLNMPDRPVYDKLSQALIECVAMDLLEPGSRVVLIYSGFQAGEFDTISVVDLDDRLGRLTVRDLRQLKTKAPLETLKMVVDLAVDIGREGREGKRVGALFVIGDVKKVVERSRPLCFDPFKGYSRKERNLSDAKVREGVKEIAQLDGAFLVANDGTVEASCRYIDASTERVSLPKGLGTRHWSAAAISRETSAIAIAVSESSGTVRVFQDGEPILRIEPIGRAMKWKEINYEPSEG